MIVGEQTGEVNGGITIGNRINSEEINHFQRYQVSRVSITYDSIPKNSQNRLPQ